MTVWNLVFDTPPCPIYGLCMGQSCLWGTTIQNFDRTCPFPFTVVDVELLLDAWMICVDKGWSTVTEQDCVGCFAEFRVGEGIKVFICLELRNSWFPL